MENNIKSKLTKIIFYITIAFFILFVALFSALSLIQSSYTEFTINNGAIGTTLIYKNLSSIRSIIIFILLIIIGFVISKFEVKLSSKTILIIEMTIFAIVGVIYCLSYKNINVFVDSKDVYEAALGLYQGDYSVIDNKSYIGQCPQNLGLLTICYLFINILGNSIHTLTALRLVNLVFSIIAYIYLYKITNILYHNNKINLFLLLLFLSFNHLLLYSVFIYTNVIAYSLSIISIYYLIYYLKNGKRAWLSLIFIVLAIIFRKNSLIILIAEIIVLIMHSINTKKIINVLFVLLFVLGLFSPRLITSYYENKYNVVYDRELPTIAYICFGVNYHKGTPGAHINDFSDMHRESGYESEPVETYAKIYLDDTLTYFKNNPLDCLEFYIEKFICAWTDQDHDVFSNVFNEKILLEDYEPIFNDVYDAFSSLLAIGLIVFVIMNRKKYDHDFILILSVVGGFIFHFFWEIKSIYTYQYILLLLPLSAYGLKSLSNKIIK